MCIPAFNWKNFLAVSITTLVSITAFSQSTVRGTVKDNSNGEPVMFVLVALEGTEYSGSTDENGYYSLTKVPAGNYKLIIRSKEHADYNEEIVLENDKIITRNVQLRERSVELQTIEIKSDRTDQLNQVNISVESIRPQDIKKVPPFGGQPDLVQALTVIPGVVSTGDQGGQIYIRGGSPVQNKVLLDGMIVYNAFHSIGLFSVFDTDILANADVYTGGFGAQYGGRISSIMDITTRDGNKRKLDGKIGISPFGSKALIEGPLKKLGEKGGGISFVLSAKRSYLEETSKKLYPYINDGDGLPFNFTDLYGKLSFSGANGSKLNLFGFSFTDDVSNFQALANFSWANSGFGGNFVVLPTGSSVLISGNFATSSYEVRLQEPTVPDRYSSINSFNFGLDFKYNIKDDVLKYGIEVVGFKTDFQTFNPLGVQVGSSESTSELNGFFTYKINRKRFVLEPGLRLQFYGSLSVFSPEPRLGFKYKATERLRFKLATGYYTQNLIATNSDRDVINLFYGFLASPANLQDDVTLPNGNTRAVNNPLQAAIHYIVGFEFDLTEKWNLNVEGYYRDFRQVTNINRNKIFADDAANADRPDILRKDFIIETGFAMGVDMVMKYEEKNTYFWFVYSLGNVDRWDGNRWYNPVFDRTHNVNIVLSQKFGKKKNYEFSAKWNMGSGLPFTQTQGYYQPPGISEGIASDYIIVNPSELGIQFAPLNEGRLPYYHRMDINLRRSQTFKNKMELELNLGITNVYNRENVFYIDRVTGQRIDQLPILPAFGVDLAF
ncbi:MAG: TonB-dependent receptor [Flavobacteriales bacterium]|nr:TonB-dependent receptor [Flavobacteriales bacterium]